MCSVCAVCWLSIDRISIHCGNRKGMAAFTNTADSPLPLGGKLDDTIAFAYSGSTTLVVNLSLTAAVPFLTIPS